MTPSMASPVPNMSKLGALVLLGAGALLFGGCLGNGALLQDFSCKGKATIVGGGSGFTGINGTIDCGEGFTLTSGTKGSQILVVPDAPVPPGVTQGVK